MAEPSACKATTRRSGQATAAPTCSTSRDEERSNPMQFFHILGRFRFTKWVVFDAQQNVENGATT